MNAHPHHDSGGRVSIVHNGVIDSLFFFFFIVFVVVVVVVVVILLLFLLWFRFIFG